MEKITGISSYPLDTILPKFGQPRVNTPIWNESQHMFITDQYTSANGHTYYLGIRLSDRFVTVLHIGLYHSWTYINDVEIYVFDGMDRKLVGKTSIDTYYDEDKIRNTTEELLLNYIKGQLQLNGSKIEQKQLEAQVKQLVQNSYCSMLNDPNTQKRLEAVRPLLLECK